MNTGSYTQKSQYRHKSPNTTDVRFCGPLLGRDRDPRRQRDLRRPDERPLLGSSSEDDGTSASQAGTDGTSGSQAGTDGTSAFQWARLELEATGPAASATGGVLRIH